MSISRAQAFRRPEGRETDTVAITAATAHCPSYEQVDDNTIDLNLPRFQKIKRQVELTFGLSVKKYQAGAIADILEARKDVFVIAGTGSGKSLVYQILPYLLTNKIFLVVCPTLSLMSDQV